MAGYGNDAGLAAWLATNGYALPGGAPTPAVLRQRGSVYIDGVYGIRFSGQKAGGYAQDRAFPRTGASAGGTTIPDDEIPQAILDASYYAAYVEGNSPGALNASATGNKNVKRERVDGAVEVEYFEGKGNDLFAATSRYSYIEGLLLPLMLGGINRTTGAVLVV